MLGTLVKGWLRSMMCRLSQLNLGKTVISSPKRGNQITLPALLIVLFTFTAYLMSIPPHFKSGFVAYPDALYLLSVDFYISSVVWLLLIFGVIWYSCSVNRRYIYSLLVVVISIVFYGYWVVNSPFIYGPDGFYFNEISQYFLSSNSISVSKDLSYSQWPGFFVLQTFLIRVIGNEIVAHKILSLILFLSLSLVFYHWLKLATDHKLAFLGFLLFIQANLRLNSKPYASPYSLCLVFFLILLIIISKIPKKKGINIPVTMLILGSSIIISHLITSIYLISLLGMYYFFAKNRKRNNYSLYLIVLLVSWLTFYTFPGYIINISTFISGSIAQTFESPWFMHYLKQTSGEQLPPWVTVQRLTVSLTVIFLSSIWILQFMKKSISRRSFFKTLERQSLDIKIALSFVLGILILSVPSLLYKAGEVSYYIWLFSLFPLCFLAAKALAPHKNAVTALTAVFLLLLPVSFISNYYNVNTYIVREPELAGAEFIGDCKDMSIVTDFSTKQILSYFSSYAQFETTSWNPMVNPKTEFLRRLRAGNIQGDLFFYSLRTKYILRMLHGFDDLDLEALNRNMNNLTNRIYDNGIVNIFAEN